MTTNFLNNEKFFENKNFKKDFLKGHKKIQNLDKIF